MRGGDAPSRLARRCPQIPSGGTGPTICSPRCGFEQELAAEGPAIVLDAMVGEPEAAIRAFD